MHLKNFWFYKKDLLSKGKKDPFEDFNNSGLDIEMNEIGFFKTWILDIQSTKYSAFCSYILILIKLSPD